jgi:hypothetical protein
MTAVSVEPDLVAATCTRSPTLIEVIPPARAATRVLAEMT